jgi:hypothetical protein
MRVIHARRQRMSCEQRLHSEAVMVGSLDATEQRAIVAPSRCANLHTLWCAKKNLSRKRNIDVLFHRRQEKPERLVGGDPQSRNKKRLMSGLFVPRPSFTSPFHLPSTSPAVLLGASALARRGLTHLWE